MNTFANNNAAPRPGSARPNNFNRRPFGGNRPAAPAAGNPLPVQMPSQAPRAPHQHAPRPQAAHAPRAPHAAGPRPAAAPHAPRPAAAPRHQGAQRSGSGARPPHAPRAHQGGGQGHNPNGPRQTGSIHERINMTRRPRGGRRPLKANWKHEGDKRPTRRGTGTHYGKLDLAPRDFYELKKAPELKEGKLRVIVMGGNEEVGRNMTLLEYGDDIILIDMGIQFAEESMRGVDGIVQDLSYLKGREHQVRAVIITHMHMDHIGSIPYLMPLLPGVPLFSAPITLAMIAKKLEYMPDIKVDMRPVDEGTTVQLGHLKATFIGVSHSVPSSLAVIIDTPCGKVVHTGDFKVDLNPTDEETRVYLDQMKALGNENVLALLSDSTNASQSGNQVMEKDVVNDLEALVGNAKGRMLFGLISTNVVRLGQIIAIAEKYGRHVVIGGLSLKTTLDIAENLNYIRPQPGTLIDIKDIRGIPNDKILAIFPGAQGESNAAFYKLADGALKELQVVPGDTVVFSSSVIPGNERSVQFITDKFYRLGAKVVNYRVLNVHAGGHAKSADLTEVIRMIKPKYLVPIEGHHAFLHHHAAAAMNADFPREKIFIADNGQIMEFDAERNGVLTKQKLTLEPIFVAGDKVGEIDIDTLRERKRIGDEGVLIIYAHAVGKKLNNLRVDCVGFRRQSIVQALKPKLVSLIAAEYPKVADAPDTHKRLRGAIEKFLERELGAMPFITMHL